MSPALLEAIGITAGDDVLLVQVSDECILIRKLFRTHEEAAGQDAVALLSHIDALYEHVRKRGERRTEPVPGEQLFQDGENAA